MNANVDVQCRIRHITTARRYNTYLIEPRALRHFIAFPAVAHEGAAADRCFLAGRELTMNRLALIIVCMTDTAEAITSFVIIIAADGARRLKHIQWAFQASCAVLRSVASIRACRSAQCKISYSKGLAGLRVATRVREQTALRPSDEKAGFSVTTRIQVMCIAVMLPAIATLAFIHHTIATTWLYSHERGGAKTRNARRIYEVLIVVVRALREFVLQHIKTIVVGSSQGNSLHDVAVRGTVVALSIVNHIEVVTKFVSCRDGTDRNAHLIGGNDGSAAKCSAHRAHGGEADRAPKEIMP